MTVVIGVGNADAPPAVPGTGPGTPTSEEIYVRRLKARFARLSGEAADAGMSTAEYAVGTVAAVGFAGLLFKVVTSDTVQAALTSIIEKALQ
jgi:hypothetical protein